MKASVVIECKFNRIGGKYWEQKRTRQSGRMCIRRRCTSRGPVDEAFLAVLGNAARSTEIALRWTKKNNWQIVIKTYQNRNLGLPVPLGSWELHAAKRAPQRASGQKSTAARISGSARDRSFLGLAREQGGERNNVMDDEYVQ